MRTRGGGVEREPDKVAREKTPLNEYIFLDSVLVFSNVFPARINLSTELKVDYNLTDVLCSP